MPEDLALDDTITSPGRWFQAALLTILVAHIAVVTGQVLHNAPLIDEPRHLVAGARHGYRHLSDSNLDWGHDLLLLKRWKAEFSPDAPIGLAYSGPVTPDDYDIDSCIPEGIPVQSPSGVTDRCRRCSYLVISANLLLISRRPKVIQTDSGLLVLCDSAFARLRGRVPDMIVGSSLFVFEEKKDDSLFAAK